MTLNSDIYLALKNTPFLFDKTGRVRVEDNKVYRIINDTRHIEVYKKLLLDEEVENLFAKGLVRTHIVETNQANTKLILEHERIPFFIVPSEYTNKMFWESAILFITLLREVYKKHKLITIDCHPYNITFNGAKPCFFDFSSFTSGSAISQRWINEFERTFAIPIKLASFSGRTYPFSLEYRREHGRGFGNEVFKNKWVGQLINSRFKKLKKYKTKPDIFFNELLKWLENNKPIPAPKEYWSHYDQWDENEIDKPRTFKQKFVYSVLKEQQPSSVIDFACNKGFYAVMAAKMGADVIAFDYEEETVDECQKLVGTLTNKVTTVLMNFNYPTSNTGYNLFVSNSFKRYNSEMGFALGLIHHICLIQKLPVYYFCELCMNYTSQGIVLEFVDPDDKHVRQWKVEIPIDYTIDAIKKYFTKKYSKMSKNELPKVDGINRTLIYFSK